MITEHIKKHFAALGIAPDEAIIVGSGILAILGIRESNDIDLMVSQETFQRVADKGHPVSRYHDGTGRMVISDVELMHSWRGRTIDDFIGKVTQIDGLLFLSLHDVMAWKQEQNRPKDRQDIALIKAYLVKSTSSRQP